MPLGLTATSKGNLRIFMGTIRLRFYTTDSKFSKISTKVLEEKIKNNMILDLKHNHIDRI